MIQEGLREFGIGLAQICKAYHYRVPENTKPAYAVWQELSAMAFFGSNHAAETKFSIAVDYYTKKEFDNVIDEITAYLDGFGSWTVESVQFETETNIIHYEWRLDYA